MKLPTIWIVCDMQNYQLGNPRNARTTPWGSFNFRAIEVEKEYKKYKGYNGWVYPKDRRTACEFRCELGDVFPTKKKALKSIKRRITKELVRIKKLLREVEEQLKPSCERTKKKIGNLHKHTKQ